jgi:hypothetical protein
MDFVITLIGCPRRGIGSASFHDLQGKFFAEKVKYVVRFSRDVTSRIG